MNRLIGSEIEYGIYIEGRDPATLIEETRALLGSYAGPAVGDWDASAEDPRRDLRGFRAKELTRNPADAQFDLPGTPRLSPREERCDRILANGARFYNDHGHPEYSTPECRSVKDLVVHEKAGERIVWQCACARSEQLSSREVRVYKNNTDYHGFSYGSHENYLFPREVLAERLIGGLLPFLVSRPIFAGSGKMGIEGSQGPVERGVYQLSQRADFFSVDVGIDTLHRRPIFNTRDEAHADPSRFRRIHVIAGDANLCEWALALKVGTTHLVLRLLEEGWDPDLILVHPVESAQQISRDPELRVLVDLADSRRMTAIDIQRVYLDAAREKLSDLDTEERWILEQWGWVLDELSAISGHQEGPSEAGYFGPRPAREKWAELASLARPLQAVLDWAAKLGLLAAYVEAEGVAWDHPSLESLDLEYHNLSPAAGLYRGLEAAGQVERLCRDEEIEAATLWPPQDTRAAIRGLCVLRWPEAVEAVRWGRIYLSVDGQRTGLYLDSAVDGAVKGCIEAAASAKELNDFIRALRPLEMTNDR